MRRTASLLICSALLATGCGKSGLGPDAPGGTPTDGAAVDAPGHTPGMPGLGGRGLAFYHLDANDSGSITAALPTQRDGSTIVVAVGRGNNLLFELPTDNKANSPYQQVGEMHPYAPYFPESGTAVYAFPSARGGADFAVSTATGKNAAGQADEITIAAVEVIEGREIHDFAWNQPTDPPLTSASVTTTAPATLIALWWGNGYFHDPFRPQSAVPDSGFSVVATNASELDSFVQCVVAVKNVTEPATYRVTWTAMPTQGAQLWLIAVQ